MSEETKDKLGESTDDGMKKPMGGDMEQSMETREPMERDMDDSMKPPVRARVGRWPTSKS